jgi:hypothetical protein
MLNFQLKVAMLNFNSKLQLEMFTHFLHLVKITAFHQDRHVDISQPTSKFIIFFMVFL